MNVGTMDTGGGGSTCTRFIFYPDFKIVYSTFPQIQKQLTTSEIKILNKLLHSIVNNLFVSVWWWKGEDESNFT